ncbi:DUF3558 domain-containing protein [Nocardia terpenica]|uniref:DUF3558 domain-containing protein n=2 Tax=Nocardia terpenica TaxID=455432 RepID=A0A6G9Z901_9NOCA|nr:DUF3558 domain-containing protein [Nocardia terpenica]
MTRGGMGVRGAALVVGAVLVLGGCGKSTDGAGASSTPATSAAATTTESAANLWDPCALSDSVLTETGLDPATKQAGVFGKQFPGSKSCAWTSNTKWYDLTIYSIGRTLQEIRNRPDMMGFTATTVGSHEAVQFFEDDDSKHLNCFIAVGLRQGSVTFETQTNYSVGKQGDPCVEVRRHADDLNKYLPES